MKCLVCLADILIVTSPPLFPWERGRESLAYGEQKTGLFCLFVKFHNGSLLFASAGGQIVPWNTTETMATYRQCHCIPVREETGVGWLSHSH